MATPRRGSPAVFSVMQNRRFAKRRKPQGWPSSHAAPQFPGTRRGHRCGHSAVDRRLRAASGERREHRPAPLRD